MDEQRKDLPETAPESEKKPEKTPWQLTKESWYDKVPLTVKQLDIIIALGLTGLAIVFVLICLDAIGVF